MFPKSKIVCTDFLKPTEMTIFFFYSFSFHFLSIRDTTMKSSFLSRTFAKASTILNTLLWKYVLLGFNRPWSVLQKSSTYFIFLLDLGRASQSSYYFWRGEKLFLYFSIHSESSSAVADDHMAISSRHFPWHFGTRTDTFQGVCGRVPGISSQIQGLVLSFVVGAFSVYTDLCKDHSSTGPRMEFSRDNYWQG